MRLKFMVAYDGGSFAGWQSQAHGGAVQDLIEAALEKIAGERIVVHGSGRTDSGVHALGQCAHVEVPQGRLDPADWQRALNASLPATIRILRAQKVRGDFHARFDAKGKIYRYEIYTGSVLPPLLVGRVWHEARQLDPALLREAAQMFVGRHDFAAFSANRGGSVTDTHRTITSVGVKIKGPQIHLIFEGEGFLYKMVRMMTGSIIRAAKGQDTIEDLRSRLHTGGPRTNHVAPAAGLYLVRVLY